jgi:thiamine-phosphate pyrophosphorylase
VSRALTGLYAIVDPAACRGRDPIEVGRAILRGGCAVLQLRDKTSGDRAVLETARALAALCREAGVPFVVDDRVDVALACGADGAHVGQDDLPLAVARHLAPSLMIGASTHDLAQLARAGEEGADLVGFGPVFSTRSKEQPDPVVGLDGLRSAVRASRVPVVAIGGIDSSRLLDVRGTGVPLFAVISAVCGADDPEAAARALHQAWLGEGAT